MGILSFFKKESKPTTKQETFEMFVKSFGDVMTPDKNTLLRALYEYNIHAGVITTIQDDPTAYLTEGYSGNSDVYSIINRIIRMASQARLVLYTVEGGKWKEVQHPELSYFTKVANPTMKMSDFIQGHLIYKLSIGNSYWYKPILEVGANKGKTKELWLMPSNNVEILGGTSWMNPVGAYQLNQNTTVKFTTDEVYHSKFFNPLFGEIGSLYGQSPLKAAARTVSKQNQAELTEQKQFQNQSPPYLLFKDGTGDFISKLTSTQTDEIESIFKNYNQKYKSGQPIVLPDKFGMLKLGVSPVDLGILESSQEGRRVLCNIYGLQSELFNDKASSTYNNVIEVKKDAWNNCIKPNLNDFADDLTAFLIAKIPDYKGLFYAFDYSEVAELQADMATKTAWMKAAYWTPNEIREATGVNAFPNEAMNEPWVSLSENPISVASTPPELVVPPVLKNFGDY